MTDARTLEVVVIAGLDPAIHQSLQNKMDARVEPAHDAVGTA
jgi:hypothetical protein